MNSLILASVVLASSPRVTIDLPIQTLPTLLTEVSRQTGFTHRSSVQTKDLYVFVKVQDLPAETLRSHMAEVLHGKWTENDGQYFFTAPTEEDRFLALREEVIRKELEAADFTPLTDKRLLEAINGIEANQRGPRHARSPQWSNFSRYPTPENRFLWRLLKEIGPRQLSRVSPKNVLVYSNQSIAGLSKTVQGFSSFIEQLKIDNQVVRKLVSGLPNPSSNPQRKNPLYHPYLNPEDRTDQAAHFSLVLYLLEGGMEVDGSIYDSSGESVKSMFLWPLQVSTSEEIQSLAKACREVAATLDQDFKPSDKKDLEFLMSIDKLWGLSASESGLTQSQANEIVAREIKNARKSNWLERWPTDCLRQFSKLTERNIIASVSRSVPGVYGDYHLGKKFNSVLTSGFGYTAKEGSIVRVEPDSILLSPSGVPADSYDLIDKGQILSNYIILAESGQLGLKNHCDMILALAGDEGFFDEYLSQIVGPRLTSFEGMDEAAALYGLMSRDQQIGAEKTETRLDFLTLPVWLRSQLIAHAVAIGAEPKIDTSRINVSVSVKQGTRAVMFSLNDSRYQMEIDPFEVALLFVSAERRGRSPFIEARFASTEFLEVSFKIVGFANEDIDFEQPFVARKVVGSKLEFSQMPKKFQDEVVQEMKKLKGARGIGF
jgi:hypothetical protein